MKLYYAPYTCSLSPHIVLRELGLPFKLVKVDNKTKRTADGRDFRAINLTEGPAIVQYLADLKPESGMAPATGTRERVRLQEWLNFVTSEIHAGSTPLFNAALPEEAKEFFREKLFQRLSFLQDTLSRQDYLMGAAFSVVDAYLFTVLGWCKFFSIDLGRWPELPAYVKRIGARPAVQAALRAEAAQ